MKITDAMVEKVARAISQVDEQNGGPSYDHLMTMGKHVTNSLFDRARAAISALAVEQEPVAWTTQAQLDKVKENPGNNVLIWGEPMPYHPDIPLYAAPVAAPVQEHPDDLAVDRFATAMKSKLAQKRKDGRGGWEDKAQCSADFLSQLLREHVEKGDPLDVGNLSMMLHQRGERITETVAALIVEQAPVAYVHSDKCTFITPKHYSSLVSSRDKYIPLYAALNALGMGI